MVAKLFFMLAALVSSCHCVINSTSKISTVGQELGQHVKGKELSMEVHNKIYSYTKNAKAFKNFTFEETVTFMNDLYSWEAPPDIRDNFVYSFWGYDFERRPVYYQEVGKQNFRRTVEEGTFPILERHFLQSFVHIVKSVQEADLPDDEIRNGIFIWDMEGFSMRQFSHLPTVAALVGMAKRYGDLPLDLVGNAYLINANYTLYHLGLEAIITLNHWRFMGDHSSSVKKYLIPILAIRETIPVVSTQP
ncbi:unnamed protein product [Allacma fusca]|uniref:CRAL-TRIO domain-containing protein n=1 Tax=Allacma fusca TaxID=39272 RepID=A0A8J2J6Y5_9HEXA|nr:unnamed protein product [Allacma fusca]